MRKFTLLAAAMLVAGSSMNAAENFANPKEAGTDFYIVKWDPQTNDWATSNDWEVDETFIFAMDVTGTSFEAPLKESSRNPDVKGRGMAYDIYTTNLVPEGETGGNIDGRLFHIKDNIYGMTVNFFQQAKSRYKDDMFWSEDDYVTYKATTEGQVTEFTGNFFPFGYTVDNPGQEWWNAIATPSQGEFTFRSAAYTGTKTSREYYYDDEDILAADPDPLPGLDPAALLSMCAGWGGYASPKAYNAAVGNEGSVQGVAADNSPVVAREYYNLMGQKLSVAPEKGFFFEKAIKADGSYEAVKKVNR